MRLTPDTVSACGINPHWTEPLNALAAWGITTPLRFAHALGQFTVETQGWSRFEENLYYTTPSRLVAVWPSRFTLSKARLYVRNPQGLANLVYNGRMGNRPNSNDGWLHRGSGFIHLTGRDNFKAATHAVRRLGYDVDYVRDPKLVRTDPLHMALTAGWFWQANGINRYADQGVGDAAIFAVSGCVNRGNPRRRAHHLKGRTDHTRRIYAVLKEARWYPEPSPVFDPRNMSREEYDARWHPPLVYAPPDEN